MSPNDPAPEDLDPQDEEPRADADASPPQGLSQASGLGAPEASAQGAAEAEIAADLERLRARAAEADVLEDRLKRAQAEFVNESKRIARQAEQDRRFAVEQVVKDLVPLAEGLESALAAAGEAPEVRALKDGVALVTRQLEEMLKRYGIELIRPSGQPFDPLAHEAILMVDRADAPPNSVAEVIRPGFRLHGRVVRPAQVTVARAPAARVAETPRKGVAADEAEGD
jgi:molecular chaperone GrpE